MPAMKFKTLGATAAAFLLAASALGQTPPAAPDFSPAAFRAHVAFLADDALEGREAGTRGYEIAARYVASEFEGLGLQPGAHGSWYQPIRFIRYAMSGTPTLTVGGHVFSQGEGISFRARPSRDPVAIDAPMVFAGYGLDAPQAGFDDYAGLDVRGKIVVVLAGTPRDLPSDVAADLRAEKGHAAAARGAAGMIQVTMPPADGAPPRRASRGARPGTAWLDGDGRPWLDNSLPFTATADADTAETFFAHAPRRLATIFAEAGRGGRPHGFALGQNAKVAVAPSTDTPFESKNVIAVLPGSDPALAHEYVLLMAHLDHIGLCRPEGAADRICNGAMDNATGISTLIEVARAMSGPGNRPRRPVIFAAVTAEEKGLLGSEFLARNPVTDGRIVGVVNLDMPVLTYDFSDVIAFGAEHSTLGPIVERAAARMQVALTPDPLPQESLFTRSDHFEFVKAGVPSVFLMTGFAGEGRQRFTDFLAHRYHSPADDMNQPIDWEAGARFAQLNYLIAREIADGDQAPMWYADSFFGRTFGAGQRMAERAESGSQAAAH
jgi:hypothetical protein